MALVGSLAVTLLPRNLVLISVTSLGIGGGCPEAFLLYDAEGIGYTKLAGAVRYEGPAPLYSLDESILGEPQSDDIGCRSTPKRIDPDTAVLGDTVYPMRVTITGPGQGLVREGESAKLSVELQITDYFDGGSPFVYIDRGGEILTELRLDAPSFNVSPSNEDTPNLSVGFERLERMEWIVAPQESTLGTQSLLLTVSTPNQTLRYDVELEVRTVFGLRPLHGAIVAVIGAFVIAGLTAAKYSTQLWDWFQKRREEPIRDDQVNRDSE